MSGNLKRRVEKLEDTPGIRPRYIVFHHKDGDVKVQYAEYLAETPEPERAEIIVTAVDPTGT